MSEYTRRLSAVQLIEWIANDYVELSHEKIVLQRNDYINNCRDWLVHNDKQLDEDDIVYRLRKRAEIRRQIPDRKSVIEGKRDRIADILEEAASTIEGLRT